jgi:purine-nucleoside phosphorylase
VNDRLQRLEPEWRRRVAAAVASLAQAGCRGRIGLVLGSGLGDLADGLSGGGAVSFADLRGFPETTVPGHGGRVVWGDADGTPVVVLQGRLHPYEGLAWPDLLLPVATLGCLDLDTVLLTNAAGGLNPGYRPGDLMVIRDQVDLHFEDPLRGLLTDPWRGGGVAAAVLGRVPPAGPLYQPDKSRLLIDAAAAAGVAIHQGVYASVWGPSYETRSEIGFLRRLPADAVGMSTSPEAVLLRALGVDVVGLSCITNAAHEFGEGLTTHAEVIETGRQARDRLLEVVHAFLARHP